MAVANRIRKCTRNVWNDRPELTSHDLNDQSRIYAMGLKPSSSALASLIISDAEAPSVKNDELAAVWVP